MMRLSEGESAQPSLHWDTVWVAGDAGGGYGDWLLAGDGDQLDSRGGLRAESALHTATLLQLFTDARLPAHRGDEAVDSDPRGWWGDDVLLDGEPALGSLLWTLERAALDDGMAKRAREICEDALDCLRLQGAVARTIVRTEVRRGDQPALLIEVEHHSSDGQLVYRQLFDVLWTQGLAAAPMNFERL